MLSCELLVFDFDGVIVDGMEEYWWSARRAALSLCPGAALPEAIPDGFRALRPWIHHGWEMVLIASLFSEPSRLLMTGDLDGVIRDYSAFCSEGLSRFGWTPSLLQERLEHVRREAVLTDRIGWLAMHRPYPGVPERLASLDDEGVAWAVLTTKGKAFTAELLASMGLTPARLDGRESGPKPEVLLSLSRDWHLMGFIEDRKATLETVRGTEGLEELPCWLASWGYLKPDDPATLPDGVSLLSPECFAGALASWN